MWLRRIISSHSHTKIKEKRTKEQSSLLNSSTGSNINTIAAVIVMNKKKDITINNLKKVSFLLPLFLHCNQTINVHCIVLYQQAQLKPVKQATTSSAMPEDMKRKEEETDRARDLLSPSYYWGQIA